jgi:exonuclease SbcC
VKIHKLRLGNLNSLVGEWEIDFSDKAFQAHSIFAITGPTGAGKTTILDGICLALYGMTPRLSKINQSNNEIMSRHCAYCFAELEFETHKGIFRAYWSQRRARNKAGGKLQAYKHEISDAINGKVLESKASLVPELVREISGMDFEQFTRAILLAQGGFAAFLQASADERAPILEQITGTEIYTLISRKVHERSRESCFCSESSF